MKFWAVTHTLATIDWPKTDWTKHHENLDHPTAHLTRWQSPTHWVMEEVGREQSAGHAALRRNCCLSARVVMETSLALRNTKRKECSSLGGAGVARGRGWDERRRKRFEAFLGTKRSSKRPCVQDVLTATTPQMGTSSPRKTAIRAGDSSRLIEGNSNEDDCLSEPTPHAVCPFKPTFASPMTSGCNEGVHCGAEHVGRHFQEVCEMNRTTGPRTSTGAVVVTKGFETAPPWRGDVQCCAANGDRAVGVVTVDFVQQFHQTNQAAK